MSKFNIDSFLRFLSFILFSVFIIFSLKVIIRQALLPDDVLLRIIKKQCENVAVSSETGLYKNFTVKNYSSEEDFIKGNNDCYLVVPDKNKGSFYRALLSRKLFNSLDYLYISAEKGILVKKYDKDEKRLASQISECFINDNCSTDSEKDFNDLKITWELLKPQGGTQIRETCTGSLKDILTLCRNDFKELVSIKKLDKHELVLKMIIHRNEAFVDSKDKNYIYFLMANHLDGITLKSRGAVISLLPDDAVNNPFALIDIKARKYGLRKNEYLEDMASLYIYTSRQYAFFNKEIKEFYGPFSSNKIKYNDRLFVNANFGFIASVFEKKGSFNENISTIDGSVPDKKKHLITQMLIGRNLSYYYKKTGSGIDILDAYVKYATEKVSSARNSVMDALFILSFMNLSDNSDETNELLKELTTKLYFVDVEKFDEETPQYSGLLGKAFLEIYEKTDDLKWLEKAERIYAGWKFPEKRDMTTVRSVAYMIPVAYSLGEEKWNIFYKNLQKLIANSERNSGFITKAFYLNGIFSIEMETLIALELKKLSDKGFKNSFADVFISNTKVHLKTLTFLNEDITENFFNNRNFINGGVLSRPDSKAVSSITTVRSMNLFLGALD